MKSFNVDLDYFEHRNTKRLIGQLGKGAEVLPLKLWAYAGKHHAEDGRLSGYSESEIGSIVGWWREPGELVQALLDKGFLGQDDEGYFVPGWTTTQKHFSTYQERAKAGAAARWEKWRAARAPALVASDGDATSNAASNAKPLLKHSQDSTGQGNNNSARADDSSEKAQECADARTFARNWVSLNCPTYLRKSCLSSFETAILSLGKDRAIVEVEKAMGRQDVSNPFAYVEGIANSEDRERAAKNARPKASSSEDWKAKPYVGG